jgi:hypothetical protein
VSPESTTVDPGSREKEFVRQSEQFTELALSECGAGSLADLAPAADAPAHDLRPVVVEDYQRLTESHRAALRDAYRSQWGVAYFIVTNPDVPPRGVHPLFDITEQLADDLHLVHPLPHPLEGHPEAVRRFGPADGTVKIYDLPGRGGEAGYREVAETAEMFHTHHDGLGSGGTVETTVLYTDSGPLWGGFTYFLNVVRLSLELARSDPAAFRSLFLPDALTIIRPRGKGAIKVTTPVLFVNELGRPQSFFRVSSGEYTVTWKEGSPDLERARRFLHRHSQPFAPGSSFLHFTAKGHGCLIRNAQVAHGRTGFIDSSALGRARLLSRKWYMSGFTHSVYKHVPGMFIAEQYRRLYPEYFGQELLEGEWLYDAQSDRNTKVK